LSGEDREGIFERSFTDLQEKGCRKKLRRERLAGRIFMNKYLREEALRRNTCGSWASGKAQYNVKLPL
jgi:hypothetical protein